MNLILMASLLCAGLFFGILIFSEAGRRLGIASIKRDPEGFKRGTGAAEAAVFGLLGLLLAFTFSGAASRFEDRRHLITQEVNAIGTAYLRIDLLPEAAQPEMRELFRQYVHARSVTYFNVEDRNATELKLDELVKTQNQK